MPAFARLSLLVVALMPLLAPAQMLNDQAPPQHRLVHRNTFAVRVNPLGLLYDGRFMYRFRLYESESKALRDNFLGIGLAPTAAPTFLKIGPYVEFNPLTVLGFWAAAQFVQYTGTFNLMASFPGAQSNFSDKTIIDNGAPNDGSGNDNYVTNGWELTIGANLTLKISSVILRSQAKLVRGDFNLRRGDRVYYDQFTDVLAPNRGFYFTNDLDVLWQGLDNKLVAGARYTMTLPLYDPAQHFDPTSTATVNNSLHRVGPFVGYTFKSVDGAGFNNPTVFLLVQWWMVNRFRTGGPEEGSITRALPLIGIGFQTTGDFLSVR